MLTANDEAGAYPPACYYVARSAARAGLPPPMPPAVGDMRCDVCIVGGGFTGLSAALHLAERGYAVILLEAHRVGFGASGRNGGQVGTGQRRDQDTLERLTGHQTARALWDLGLEAVGLVKTLARRPEVNTPFHPGIIHADHRARFVPDSLAYAEKLRSEYGYDRIEGLDRAGIRALVGTDAYFGGTLDRGAGHIDPLSFALGLSRLARAAGARVFERSRVTSITAGTPVVLQTETARIRAGHLVLACNGYLGRLNRTVAARVMPINNFIIATEPLEAAVRASLIADNHAVADSRFVVNYFRFSEEGCLLFGGAESYGARFPKDIAAKVRKPMLKIFPRLAGTRIDYAWGGTLGITMSRMPHFARLSGNALALGGYSGHGVAMATLGGKLAAEAIAGQAGRFDIMASVPVPRFPGGVALRQPLLTLAMVWFSLRDRL